MSAKLQPWDIQPDEPARAYAGFAMYRDAGPARSIDKLLLDDTRSIPNWKRWSVKYGWVERVRAFDEHTARKAAAKSVNILAEARARHAELGRLMQKKGKEALEEKRLRKLSVTEATRLGESGVKIERDALDIAARVEVSWRQVVEAGEVTEEELQAEVARLLTKGNDDASA